MAQIWNKGGLDWEWVVARGKMTERQQIASSERTFPDIRVMPHKVTCPTNDDFAQDLFEYARVYRGSLTYSHPLIFELDRYLHSKSEDNRLIIRAQMPGEFSHNHEGGGYRCVVTGRGKGFRFRVPCWEIMDCYGRYLDFSEEDDYNLLRLAVSVLALSQIAFDFDRDQKSLLYGHGNPVKLSGHRVSWLRDKKWRAEQ